MLLTLLVNIKIRWGIVYHRNEAGNEENFSLRFENFQITKSLMSFLIMNTARCKNIESNK